MSDELIIEAKLEDRGLTSGLTKIKTGIAELDTTSSKLADTLGNKIGGSFQNFKTRMSDLGEATEGLRSRIDSLANSIGHGLVSGMKMAAVGMVGLVAAAGAMAWETEKTFAQFHNVVSNFAGGNVSLTAQLYNNALQYSDIVSVGQQEGGIKQLLVNPYFRNQAASTNTDIIRLAAMSGNNSSQVYSMLTNAVGRMQNRQRLDPRVLLMLQKAGVNIIPFLEQMSGMDLNPNSPLTMQAAQKYVQEIGTPTEFLNFLHRVGNSQIATEAIQKQRETPQGAMNYLKNRVEVAIDAIASGPNGFDAVLTKAIGPLTGLIAGKGGLIQTLAPPLLDFVGGLAKGMQNLLPALSPLAKALTGFLGHAINAIAPALQKMQPIGAKLGAAFYKFLSAFIPVMPALVNALVTFMQVLPAITPPLVVVAQVFAKLMVSALDFVNAIGKILNATGSMKVIGEAIGVLVGFLIAWKAVSVAIAGGKAVVSFFQDFGSAITGIRNWASGKKPSPEGPGGGSPGCGPCGGGGMGGCSELCDGGPNLKVLAGGLDAGLTKSNAGAPLWGMNMLKGVGITAAGITAISYALSNTGAIGQLLSGTAANTAATTKALESQNTVLNKIADHTDQSKPGGGAKPGSGYHQGAAGHVGHDAWNWLVHDPMQLLPSVVGSVVGVGLAGLAGKKVVDAVKDKFKKGGGGGGGGGGATEDITNPATELGKLRGLTVIHGEGGSSLPKAARNRTGLLSAIEKGTLKTAEEGWGLALDLFDPARAAHQLDTALNNARTANARGAAGATGIAGFVENFVRTAVELAPAGAANLPDKAELARQAARMHNPAVERELGITPTKEGDTHIHITNLHLHNVQDAKAFADAMKNYARDKMVRGAPSPTTWRSSGFGHTGVINGEGKGW